MQKYNMITSKNDAFGLDLWEYYTKGEAYEIVERDDGLLDAYPVERYFTSPEKWQGTSARILNLVKGKVLDVGCGAGRIALYLQKRGCKVTGIDNSPLAIKVCKLRGVKDVKVLPFENIKIFKQGQFDFVVMMGHNFGLFGGFEKAKLLLKKMHRITSKNAAIIAETNDPYKTKNPDHLKYHQHNLKQGRMSGQIKLRIRHQKVIGPWLDYLFVSKSEMQEIVKGTGWKIEKFINSKSFRSTTYIAIIKKEKTA